MRKGINALNLEAAGSVGRKNGADDLGTGSHQLEPVTAAGASPTGEKDKDGKTSPAAGKKDTKDAAGKGGKDGKKGGKELDARSGSKEGALDTKGMTKEEAMKAERERTK